MITEILPGELTKLVNSIGRKTDAGEAQTEKESTFTVERPDFGPTQIRDMAEIRQGMTIVARRFGKELSSFSRQLVTREPYQDERGDWWIETRYLDSEYTRSNKSSLADKGVTPYNDAGLWNSTNWLEDPSKTTEDNPIL